MGFRFAVSEGYRSVVQVDGDGQHRASDIHRLIDASHESEADLVLGSRFSSRQSGYEVSRIRRLCIGILASRVRSTGLVVTDPTSGFRLIREPLLTEFSRQFPAHYLGDTFEALMVAGRRGYRVIEVEVTMRERQGGRPSADAAALVRSMIRSVAVQLTGPSFDIEQRRAGP